MLRSDPRATKGLREVNELEDRIDKLRLAYEQFFSGLDNIDPTDKKVPIQRLITRLNEMHVKNPAIRFKFQSLVGRFVSLSQYWTRTMRAIADGRMERSLNRFQGANPGEAPKAYYGKDAPDLDSVRDDESSKSDVSYKPQEQDRVKRKDIRAREIDEDQIDKLKYQKPLQGPEKGAIAKSNGGGAASASRGLSDDKLDRIHKEYSDARSKSGSGGKVARDTLKRQLDSQYDTLKKKYGNSDIDFRVVEKDGRVVLRPVVKKSGG